MQNAWQRQERVQVHNPPQYCHHRRTRYAG